MINNNTTIIVAAGASNDLNIPLGPGLKKRVSQLVSSDNNPIFDYLVSASNNLFEQKNQERATLAVSRAMRLSSQIMSAASIDNFMDQHKDENDLVSYLKMVVAYALAEAEKKSLLKRRGHVHEIIEGTENYFLFDLMNIVVRGHQRDNIGNSLKNLSFVIFNYDRCVERYIDLWLKFRFGVGLGYYDLRPKFIHVYGSLGEYFDEKLQNPFEYSGDMAFQNPHLELPRFANEIKIFTEQEDSMMSLDILNAVHAAHAILFLGFGFEEQNMRFFQRAGDGKEVFATLYGASPENSEFLKADLAERFSSDKRAVYTVDGKSRKLISDCYHPLTRALGSL